MFDLAWSEIGVIGLVAVLVLGPKELPQAMRTMAKMLRKMRSLTSELQGHMNEIVREAELDEVRQSIQKLSSANIKAEISK
jgi:sec-independent protein translocase protein TatB